MSQPQADTTHRLSAALGLQAEARANFLAAGRPAPRRGIRLEDNPARATDDGAHTASLPVPLTSFIGREKERDVVLQLLDGSRLVTLLWVVAALKALATTPRVMGSPVPLLRVEPTDAEAAAASGNALVARAIPSETS